MLNPRKNQHKKSGVFNDSRLFLSEIQLVLLGKPDV